MDGDRARHGHKPRRFLIECWCGKQIDRDKYDRHVLDETTAELLNGFTQKMRSLRSPDATETTDHE